MIETVPLVSSRIPLAFFIWAPIAVMLLFWLVGFWASRQGVARMLESDWNGFTVEDVEKLFAAYGDDRRKRYRSRVLPADAAFAVFYAIVGGLIVAALAARGQPWWLAALCGAGWLFGGLCDVVENIFVARLLDRYPAVSKSDVAIASGFTRIKLVLFVVGIVGSLAAAWLAFHPVTQ